MRSAHGTRDRFLFKMFRRMRAIRRWGKDAFAQLGLDLGAGQKNTRAAGDVLGTGSHVDESGQGQRQKRVPKRSEEEANGHATEY